MDLVARTKQPDYKRILEGLRREIASGKLKPGTQLPSTRQLAARWKSNFLTVHTALTALTKEGWLDRRPSSGTFIADPKFRFSCAGIYFHEDASFNPEKAYFRSLHFSLIREFEKLKKDTLNFVDSRPESEQAKILPSLADAIRNQRIQCLIALTLNAHNTAFLGRLPIPTAMARNHLTRTWVDFDMRAMFRESVRRLKNQGCKSIGLMTGFPYGKESKEERLFYGLFEQALEEERIAPHGQWIRAPQQPVFAEFERHGYTDFKALWSESNQPDGLIVFPDLVARGVILAILEIGTRAVTERMKFVFHRNAHLPILCPLPATWATTNETLVARSYVDLIQKQFRREDIAPILIKHTFEENALN
jgi:DNA-binding LacI/PurR family transcriptional regulator